MSRIPLPINSGFFVSQARGSNDRRLSNMYKIVNPQSVTKSALVNTPGISTYDGFSVPEGATSRGVIVLNSKVEEGVSFDEYRVYGSVFYRVVGGFATALGAVEGAEDVTMASNGINIVIQVSGGKGYFYDLLTTAFSEISDPIYLSFGKVYSVSEYNGYYVYTTQSLFFAGSYKDISDGRLFNALDFEDAEISTDIIVRGWSNHNLLYIMGLTTIEIYSVIETSGFPLQRIPSGVLQVGCKAIHSVSDFNNGFVFVGGEEGEYASIYYASGSSFQKISDQSIDFIINSYSQADIALARCWTYSFNGSKFAVFTLANDTVVYDATTGEWHARQSGIGNGTKFYAWRAIHGTISDGRITVGDSLENKLGYLDHGEYEEYREPIERLIPTIHFKDKLDPLFSQEIELDMRTGVGNNDVEDPVIRMNYSDDGGYTFSDERWRKLGKVGERKKRVRWSRLGRFPKGRMFQFKITDPVPVEIYGLYGDAE